MKGLFLVVILLLRSQGMAQTVDLESASLRRQDMPDDFPYQLTNEGFAVLRIRLVNHSEESLELKVDEIEVYNQKGKRIERALPTEITPKILKYYTGITSYGGYREERSSERIVSMDTVEGLRKDLERHQIEDTQLAPDETVGGLYYLRSKKSGAKLSGGWVIVNGIRAEY